MANGTDTFNRSFKMSRSNTSYNSKKDPYNTKSKRQQGPSREIGIPVFKLGQLVNVKPYNDEAKVVKIGLTPSGFRYQVRTNSNELMWVPRSNLIKRGF